MDRWEKWQSRWRLLSNLWQPCTQHQLRRSCSWRCNKHLQMGSRLAELVLVHGVLSSGCPVFGTQQSAWQSFGSEPQSHSSQPSTTELPHTPCTGFTLQQPRLLGRSCAMASRLHCAGRKPRLPFSAIRCSPSGPGGQEDAVSCGAPKLCATSCVKVRAATLSDTGRPFLLKETTPVLRLLFTSW